MSKSKAPEPTLAPADDSMDEIEILAAQLYASYLGAYKMTITEQACREAATRALQHAPFFFEVMFTEREARKAAGGE